MNRLIQNGKTIIMISSKMPELMGMWDRVIVLSESRITGEQAKEEFSQDKILSYASVTTKLGERAEHKKIVKKYAIILALVVIIIVFSIATPRFLTLSNLMNVARQVSMAGVASVGMLFVILLGGINLSVGSAISMVNVICAILMVKLGLHPLAASILRRTFLHRIRHLQDFWSQG